MKMPAATELALTAGLLAAMGVPAHETGEVQPADDAFAHHRVTTFDAAQFGGGAPDERLSEYAVRWQDPGAALPDAIRRFLAPDVPANRGRFVEYALYHGTEGVLALDDPIEEARALGADFPTLRNPPHQLVTERIANRGLTVEVDEDEGCLGAGWQQARVAFLRGVLDRARLRRTVALFVAGAVRVGRSWNTASDPDGEVLDELDAQPLRATRVMYDPRAWSQRGRALRESRRGVGEPANGGAESAEELRGRFAVEQVQVIRTPAAAHASGGAATRVKGQVLLFCAADHLSRNDFSNLKTFTAPAKTGGRYAAYVSRVGDKRWRVGVECHETVALTSAVGLEMITVG